MNLTKMEKFDSATPGPYWYMDGKNPILVCTNGHRTLVSGPIELDGRVTPLFQCVHGGCGFREHVVLEGYGPATT